MAVTDAVAFIANSGSFGDVCADTLKDLELTIQNNGLCPLEVTAVALTAVVTSPLERCRQTTDVLLSDRDIRAQIDAETGLCSVPAVVVALVLTPVLCATLLKPAKAGHGKRGFFGWFNRGFARTAKAYESLVARILGRAARYLVIYAAIIAAVVVLFGRLPTSFIPNEDQGNILVNVQLPPGATQNRTLSVMQQVEQYTAGQDDLEVADLFGGERPPERARDQRLQ